MNQKISTSLGTAIILVMAFTAGYFVWVYNNKITYQEIPGIQVEEQSGKLIPKNESNQILDSNNTLVYSSDNYKFNFSYPSKKSGVDLCLYSSYTDVATHIEYIDISMNCPQPPQVYSGDFNFNTVASIKISPWRGSLMEFVKAQQEANTSGVELTVMGPTVTNGKEVYKIVCPESKVEDGEMPNICADVWLIKNSNYVFEFSHDAEPILKTIKFML